jgi:hypothetical protein
MLGIEHLRFPQDIRDWIVQSLRDIRRIVTLLEQIKALLEEDRWYGPDRGVSKVKEPH